METNLIILRGNSGSGKTTTAKNLQNHLGHGTLLVSQDVVRREMLKVHDREGNLAINLIRQIAEYGKGQCKYVIVEGILYRSLYGEMLWKLIQFYNPNTYTYYFELPFEETLKRHNSSSKKMEFGEESLRSWWRPNDYLDVDREKTLTRDLSQDAILNLILSELEES